MQIYDNILALFEIALLFFLKLKSNQYCTDIVYSSLVLVVDLDRLQKHEHYNVYPPTVTILTNIEFLVLLRK